MSDCYRFGSALHVLLHTDFDGHGSSTKYTGNNLTFAAKVTYFNQLDHTLIRVSLGQHPVTCIVDAYFLIFCVILYNNLEKISYRVNKL